MTTLAPSPTTLRPSHPPAPPARLPAPSSAPTRTGAPVPPPAHRPARDPFVTGVRVVGTLLVVALHWLMVEAVLDDGRLQVGNALGHGSAWLLTWLQPLPLLFFAAGASARYDLARRSARSGWRFAAARLPRMALPVAVLLGAWGVLLLGHLGLPEQAVRRVARIVPQPLWFLGVQLVLLALTPWLLRLARRSGVAVLVAAGAAALLVDVLRFGRGAEALGAANLLLVWAVPYLGGLVYADRRLVGAGGCAAGGCATGDCGAGDRAAGGTSSETASTGASGGIPLPALRGLTLRGLLGLLLAGGLLGTVVLLAVGPYPVSLIGMPGDAVSNLAPPTAPVVTFAVAQVAGALLARDAIARWAGRSRLAAWVDARSMGLYLWHLTAMFGVCGAVLLGAGRALPVPWTWDWWTTRAGYLGAAALLLTVLVALAGRVERVLRWRPSRGRRGGPDRAPGQASRRTTSTAPVPPISTTQARATRPPVTGPSTVSVRS